MEDAEGDVDMVLEEEGAKIEEKERIAKEELEKELRQYRIKVCVKMIFIKNRVSRFCSVLVRIRPSLSRYIIYRKNCSRATKINGHTSLKRKRMSQIFQLVVKEN